MFHSTLMTFHAMVLWETTESSLGKLSQNCSNVSTHLLSPNILQQEDCPLNSCVYFILVQYPLRIVNAPEEGPLSHPYDFTWSVSLSPLSPPLCVSETPRDNVFITHDCVTSIHSNKKTVSHQAIPFFFFGLLSHSQTSYVQYEVKAVEGRCWDQFQNSYKF